MPRRRILAPAMVVVMVIAGRLAGGSSALAQPGDSGCKGVGNAFEKSDNLKVRQIAESKFFCR